MGEGGIKTPMTTNQLLRSAVQGSVTEAYDAADAALREVQNIAPDVASMVQTARDLLFAARVKLDESA